VIVLVVKPRAFRRWLKVASQALLDRVCELADAPQEELLKGIAEELRQRLKEHRARPVCRARVETVAGAEVDGPQNPRGER
jgi:hypothetical protein